MPATNPLAFLRPLYDLAVWQFLLMIGARQREDGHRVTMTYKMHEVVACFMCKLLQARAFRHLIDKMKAQEVRTATGGWEEGENPTKKLIEWCQDQWRRKKPFLPEDKEMHTEPHQIYIVPHFTENAMPLCYSCGTPCPKCRDELGLSVPVEMLTAHSLLDNPRQAVTARDNLDNGLTMRLRNRNT